MMISLSKIIISLEVVRRSKTAYVTFHGINGFIQR